MSLFDPGGAPFRGVYLRDRTLEAMNQTAFASWVLRAVECGVTTLVAKAGKISSSMISASRAAGLRVIGSMPCYVDRAGYTRKSARLRPVGADGRQFEQMEWYAGLIPTEAEFNDTLVARSAHLAADRDLDGLILDFIRWPLHWELELRPGATPRLGSFDPVTLEDFQRWSEKMLPEGAVAAARCIEQHLQQEWWDYRCSVISDVVRRISRVIRRERPDMWLAAFLVPAEEVKRRRLVGQSVADLSTLVDAFIPMTYHAILHRPYAWITSITGDVAAHTDRPVITMIQATSDAGDPSIDWGPPITARAFAEAFALAGHQWCVWPGDALDMAKWSILKNSTRLQR